jgi:hypothetical protein
VRNAISHPSKNGIREFQRQGIHRILRLDVRPDGYDIQEAIATTGKRRCSCTITKPEECEFEEFARDVLGVLGRHSDQLITGLRVFCALDKARVMFHRAVACLCEEAVARYLKQR